MRNTISGDYETMVAREKNKIVTKVVDRSNWSGVQRNDLRLKAEQLQHEVAHWIMSHPLAQDNIKYYYREFRIPKHSGGYRTLSAPEESLKILQKKILNFLLEDCKILCHNAVHSYVKHRNCKTALETHQRHGAHWFLKLDIKDFFDNCMYEPVIAALYDIHPLHQLTMSQLRGIFCVCFLEGKLPQGAPTSPMLSNLFLQHFDYTLTKELRGYTYTRYADDMIISNPVSFRYTDILRQVTMLLPQGLIIKMNKLRYGSCNGSNWNLGLMFNKDQEITVGYRNKHTVKNRIHNLFRDEPPEDTPERLEWVQRLCELKGVLGYYAFIEPEYFNELIKKYQDKGYNL
jgi:hypothetical protein